jgi:hypothetical protein
MTIKQKNILTAIILAMFAAGVYVFAVMKAISQ